MVQCRQLRQELNVCRTRISEDDYELRRSSTFSFLKFRLDLHDGVRAGNISRTPGTGFEKGTGVTSWLRQDDPWYETSERRNVFCYAFVCAVLHSLFLFFRQVKKQNGKLGVWQLEFIDRFPLGLSCP